MIDIAAIAASHNIAADELAASLAEWDLNVEKLAKETPEAIDYLTRTVNSYATRIADYHEKIAARRAAIDARKPVKTAAAKARPEAACYKCDGAGRINGFGHVSGGVCFACGGAGVRHARKAA